MELCRKMVEVGFWWWMVAAAESNKRLRTEVGIMAKDRVQCLQFFFFLVSGGLLSGFTESIKPDCV